MPGLPAWLGDGSLSLVAHLVGTPGRVTAESFDLTAAALHASGMLALSRGDGEPRVTGRISTGALPLPLPNGNSDVPLPIDVLHGWQGDLTVDAEELDIGARGMLRDASASVTVAKDALRITKLTGRLGGGLLSGEFEFDGAARPPMLALRARVNDAKITGPLADAPLDLTSGRMTGNLELSASGYSPATILATMSGHLGITAGNGTLSGFDLFRAKLAVENLDAIAAQTAAADALQQGTTGFDRLDVAATWRTAS